MLIGAKGLFSASKEVEYSEWQKFIQVQNIHEKFPGIQGIGFIQHVTNSEKQNFVSSMKTFLPNYNITPDGERSDYFVVKYLEPEDFRNKRALGYDVYSEKTRQNAINIAMDTHETTITNKLVLVQETDTDIQNGFLMLLPIDSLKNHDPDDTIGLVYAVFRINDFMEKNLDSEKFQSYHLKIYDGIKSDDNLFFDSYDLYPEISEDTDFYKTFTVSIYNKDWIFEYEGISYNHGFLDFLYVLIIGTVISFLILYVILMISKNSELSKEIIRQEKMSAIGRIGATIAHDIRNPLTSLNASLELLRLKKTTLTEFEEKCYSQIHDSAKRIEYLVSDILNFSQTRSLVKEDSSILELIQNSIKDIKISSGIKINFPKNDLLLPVDKIKFTSVLTNLLKNSIESVGDKGEITIVLQDYPREATITISDTANALSLSDIPQIFEPLYTTKTNGTGLGLPSCKNIITEHGGKIKVTVNPTTFTIVLPKK